MELPYPFLIKRQLQTRTNTTAYRYKKFGSRRSFSELFSRALLQGSSTRALQSTSNLTVFNIKFAILSLLPLLVAASTLGGRDVTVMDNDPETVDVLELKSSSQRYSIAQLICPPGYTKYCPRGGFCCPAATQACCPSACCYSRDAMCGSDSLCCIRQ
ncbi:hypothetical protein BM221_005049 [Beauveria bassiana]|uniref:Granulins domain-containing protein n=1 Tax=Beauveria bassiana TaxID=176275 RepID=A0A2N6NMH1_BEABA|nr:hypothetical protein BM221_005049 [Beauveria bassiana]